LALALGETFVRVQCKTARIEGNCVKFSCQSVRSNTKGALARDYRGDADLFIAYCPANDRVYAVPVDEAGRTQIMLRLNPPANNQKVGVRWATDYELPA
jgi:PD-(D/E)XK nuclease superfamily protein